MLEDINCYTKINDFIYINNNQKQDIMEGKISFIIATNNIMFLRINLKEMWKSYMRKSLKTTQSYKK